MGRAKRYRAALLIGAALCSGGCSDAPYLAPTHLVELDGARGEVGEDLVAADAGDVDQAADVGDVGEDLVAADADVDQAADVGDVGEDLVAADAGDVSDECTVGAILMPDRQPMELGGLHALGISILELNDAHTVDVLIWYRAEYDPAFEHLREFDGPLLLTGHEAFREWDDQAWWGLQAAGWPGVSTVRRYNWHVGALAGQYVNRVGSSSDALISLAGADAFATFAPGLPAGPKVTLQGNRAWWGGNAWLNDWSDHPELLSAFLEVLCDQATP